MMLQETPEFLPENEDIVVTAGVDIAVPQPAAMRVVAVPDAARLDDADVEICARYYGLTLAEQDIFALIAAGASARDVARQLGITETASEFLRMKLFQKMGAASLIDLLVMAKVCDLT